MPRDAAFYIKDGEIKNSVEGIRISGNMVEYLKNIEAISKERKWIKWWKVQI